LSTYQKVQEELGRLLHKAESNPDNPELLNEIGVGYLILGNKDEAISYLEKASKLGNFTTTLYNLANAYSENDQPLKAQELYLRVLEEKPDHIPSLNNLADCFEQTGNEDKAEELFNYLTCLNDQDPISHLNLGNFLLRQNRHIEAVKCFQTSLERDEHQTDAYYNISWVLMKAGAFDKALEYAENGLENEPDHPDLLEIASRLKKKISE
jgi:tetratricopeptide (TPR) repeat protein